MAVRTTPDLLGEAGTTMINAIDVAVFTSGFDLAVDTTRGEETT